MHLFWSVTYVGEKCDAAIYYCSLAHYKDNQRIYWVVITAPVNVQPLFDFKWSGQTWLVIGLWCWKPLSTIFQLYCGRGNWSARKKPPICRKSLTNFITSCCIEYTWPEWDLNSQRVSGDRHWCIGTFRSCKSKMDQREKKDVIKYRITSYVWITNYFLRFRGDFSQYFIKSNKCSWCLFLSQLESLIPLGHNILSSWKNVVFFLHPFTTKASTIFH
jgi:hypothetical protein